MSAHTPGPWAVAVWDTAKDPVEQFREHLSHGSGPIWGVWCPEHPLTKGHHPNPEHAVMACLTGNGPTSEANARLIAAAPELLAALKESIEFSPYRGESEETPFLRRARAAIAKAEGKS